MLQEEVVKVTGQFGSLTKCRREKVHGKAVSPCLFGLPLGKAMGLVGQKDCPRARFASIYFDAILTSLSKVPNIKIKRINILYAWVDRILRYQRFQILKLKEIFCMQWLIGYFSIKSSKY